MAEGMAAADDYELPLPGFRFHPTDEELVGFYLRRKVHNKALAIQLIKQIDIYKYNPWDLPDASNALQGEKEWYFFCKRGRKYKNSVRPNRVTGCGFWKATGIDKPIYAHSNNQYCIGLKKTLVFYRGSAGRGTKTEWMMNEFRLPSSSSSSSNSTSHHPFPKIIANNNLQEAEIWTLCRIFKRNVSYRKGINSTPNWMEVPAGNKSRAVENVDFRTSGNMDLDTYSDDNEESSYISFASNDNSFFASFDHVNKAQNSDQMLQGQTKFCASITDPNSSENVSPASSSFSDFDEDATDLFGYEKWEELKSILESDLDS